MYSTPWEEPKLKRAHRTKYPLRHLKVDVNYFSTPLFFQKTCLICGWYGKYTSNEDEALADVHPIEYCYEGARCECKKADEAKEIIDGFNKPKRGGGGE